MENGAERFDLKVVELPQDVADLDLVTDFMRLRKRVFVDGMEWPLMHADGVEFEQYDTFQNTCYVIAHINRRVLGGARLKPTCATNGSGTVYSYMIRDAYLGLLPGMPRSLCAEDPPVDPSIWELTRFAAVDRPGGIGEAVLQAANDFLHKRQAQRCLFLGPPAFLRMAKRLGWTPEALGPVVGNDDGRFLAFGCGVNPPNPENNHVSMSCT